jgi:hypothetical protein
MENSVEGGNTDFSHWVPPVGEKVWRLMAGAAAIEGGTCTAYEVH